LPDACAIASQAELETIVDTRLSRANSFDTDGNAACMWVDADELDAVQIILYRSVELYELSRAQADSKPLIGVGVDAHIGKYGSIQVRTPKRALFTQSTRPVKDGQISAEVRAAASDVAVDEVAKYEASFRVARLISGKL
jgi:hypothetical protein